MKKKICIFEDDLKMTSALGYDLSLEDTFVTVTNFSTFYATEKQYKLDAYLYWNNTTTVGGDLAEVQYYTRMPHYPGTWKKGVLQFVPTSIRYFGKPTVIKAGEEVTFVMNSDVKLFPYKEN